MEYVIEKVTREECTNCKKLALHCRKRPCKAPKYETFTREYKKVVETKKTTDGGLPIGMTEEERQKVIKEKLMKREEKKARNQQLSEVMQMDDAALEKKNMKEERERKNMELEILKRAQENVDLLKKKEAELLKSGLPKHEVKAQIKQMKKDMREEASKEESPTEQQPELKNPIKCPETGKFIEDPSIAEETKTSDEVKETETPTEPVKKRRGRKKKTTTEEK